MSEPSLSLAPRPAPRPEAAEVEALHAVFQAWFLGELDDLGACERRLAPGFELVSPAGERLGRGQLLELLRGGKGRRRGEDFAIRVEAVRARRVCQSLSS